VFDGTMQLPMIRTQPLTIARCGSCGLFQNCNSPKMPIWGRGLRKVLIIGEAPGADEDRDNKPFVGRAGQRLRQTLDQIGVDLDSDCWVTNSLICRPPSNAQPTSNQIDFCRPNLVKAVRELKPEIIIPLGASAVESVLGWLWKPDPGGITMWAGWRIPHQRINTWICPTFHPSHLLYEDTSPVASILFEKHLQAAFALKGRPWNKVPDFRKRCRIFYNVHEAEEAIREMVKGLEGRPIAFDYESTSLKPDLESNQIVCCSLSNGRTSIAYPWHGPVVRLTKDIVTNPDIPKVGANVKFEIRWTLAKHGVMPRKMWWDTVVAAHILDNRSGTAGVKFQSFVRLGQEPYNTEVESYLKSDGGGNAPNRIKDCDLGKLMLYNSMDSILEWHIARSQRKEMDRV
jgi:uracil-DNA glycosylase family 4